MTIHFDEKGKIFTNIISKNAVSATVQCLTHKIHGFVYVRQGERIKDELNREDRFLPITDADIYDGEGHLIHHTGFMVLNQDHIIWLIPDEEIQDSENSTGATS